MKRNIFLFVAMSWAFAQNQPPRYKAIFEPVNVKADVKLFDAYFVSEDSGWVAGGASELRGGAILYTADGGKTWTTQLGDFQSSDAAVRMLRFIDPQTGWGVQKGRLLHTTDGQNWNQSGAIPEHVADYAFTSGTHGLYVEGDRIDLTDDSGQHWKTVATCNLEAEVNGLTQRFHCGYTAIHFPTASTGYAVAKGGPNGMFILFKTVDGGASWRGATIPGDKDAQDVFFLDAGVGYIRTGYPDTGRLFRTADGGRTFTGMAASPGDRVKFADPGVGWAFHYGKMSFTTSGGDRWSSRSFKFPASVYTFSLPSRRRGYVVGEHGMVYRYSIVPVEYTAPGMIDAPMMPGYDLPVADEVQKLKAPIAALRTKLQAASKAAAARRVRMANAFFQQAPQAAAQTGGFVQDTTAQPFVQDTTIASTPAGAGVSSCCAAEMQNLQTSFSGFSQSVPAMVTPYRSLNLLLAAFHLFSDLAGRFQSVTNSFKALKAAPDTQTASAALTQFSSQLDQMAQSSGRALQTPLK